MRLLSLTVALRIAVACLLTVEVALDPHLVASEIVPGGEARSQERSRMETHDDLLLRVERMVPGFGGMFIEVDGRLAVYLLDTSPVSAAGSAIETVFGPSLTAGGVRAVQGQYTVSQLKAWTERASAVVLDVPGVTMVDVNEAKNRVTIGVEDDSRTHTVKDVLSSLKIPREAVLIQVTGQINPVNPR